MNRDELHKRLIEVAAQSPAKKRKVGAIVAACLKDEYFVISEGHNFNLHGGPCEDHEGFTVESVIHAEVSALNEYEKINIQKWAENNNIDKVLISDDIKVYCTHPPCDGCKAAIKALGIDYEVMGDFLKFDNHKPRVFHVPGSLTMWVGKVITYGIKKYKINNWRKVKSQESYWNALDRHLCAVKEGELIDPETGLPHAAHIACNAAFLLELQHLPLYVTEDGEEIHDKEYTKLFKTKGDK